MKTDHPHRPPGHLQTLPRRQFVKLAALTGGAIAAPAITPFSLLGRGEIAQPDAGMTRIELAHEDYNKDLTDHGPWTGMAAAEEGGTICKQLDPERYYQPSSPYGGANANDSREDNTHGYSNMCFVPGYDYLNFASEDNRVAAPVLHRVKRFMKPEHLWPEVFFHALPARQSPSLPQDLAALYLRRELEEDRGGRAILRRHLSRRASLPDRHGGGALLPRYRRAPAARPSGVGTIRTPSLRRLHRLERQRLLAPDLRRDGGLPSRTLPRLFRTRRGGQQIQSMIL
jgi:hypothetical protein